MICIANIYNLQAGLILKPFPSSFAEFEISKLEAQPFQAETVKS